MNLYRCGGGLSNLTLITSSNTKTTYDVGKYKIIVLYMGVYSDNYNQSFLQATGCTALVENNQININGSGWYKSKFWIWRVDSKDATVCPYIKFGSGSMSGLFLYGIK